MQMVAHVLNLLLDRNRCLCLSKYDPNNTRERKNELRIRFQLAQLGFLPNCSLTVLRLFGLRDTNLKLGRKIL